MSKRITQENKMNILAEAFLMSPSIAEICKKTGICRSTVYEMMEKPEFQEKLDDLRKRSIGGAISYLQHSFGNCAKILVEIAEDETVAPQTRANAATAVMNQCSTWTKLFDFEQRLASLERSINDFSVKEAG
ncbi:MAG: hypothetical protein LIO81_07890 [Clostridiales bacterium]|nr:hypothetical protein [Clostridiales bacterium]